MASRVMKNGYVPRALVNTTVTSGSAGAQTGAKLLCLDVPDDMKVMGFCLF